MPGYERPAWLSHRSGWRSCIPWYAANETYLAAELAVLDQLADQVPTTDRWVTLGAFFDHVTAAVREVGQTDRTGRPLQIALTCGRLEENFANNDAMASVLADQGHLVVFAPVADLHNYTAWRDALHPTLTHLLRTVWSPLAE